METADQEERRVEGWALVGDKCGEVTLFCRVTRGGVGVAGAEVSATVEVMGGAGAGITENLDRPNMPVTNLASSRIHILKI